MEFKDFHEFINWCVIDRNTDLVYAQKQVYLLKAFQKQFSDFNITNIRNFLISQKPLKKPSTLQKYITTFRLYNTFGIYKGILKEDFCKDIPLPKRDKELPTTLSVSEVEAILNCKLTHTYGHFENPEKCECLYNTVLELLALTGCRLGEALSLKIQNIDWITGVWKLDHTKTRQGRLIPIPPQTLTKMELIVEERSPDEYIFINPLSKLPMRHHQIERNFRLRLQKTGIRKLATVHTLRHSFITELLRQNISISKIANIVGHSRIQMTADYGKLLYDDLRIAVMSHPLNIVNNSPGDVINNLKEDIDKYNFPKDKRFKFETKEGSNYFDIRISFN
jgi:site-specific recombinase XerD